MDLPTSIAIAVGTITAGGIALKAIGSNSSKKYVSREMCKDNRENIQEDLEKGEKKFDKLFEALQEQGKTLARIDERTLLWEKRGLKNDHL